MLAHRSLLVAEGQPCRLSLLLLVYHSLVVAEGHPYRLSLWLVMMTMGKGYVHMAGGSGWHVGAC